MKDSGEEKIRALSQSLTSQQLKEFMGAFPEFRDLNDSLTFRRLVALTFLFAQKKIEKDEFPEQKIADLKEDCIKLLGEDISAEKSELFKWLDSVGKGRKGKNNIDKFLIGFERFLADKLINSVRQKISFEELTQLFPVFDVIDEEIYEEEVGELMRLINQFISVPDKMAVRYKSMWMVIQIALLVEAILPGELCQDDDITLLKDIRTATNNTLSHAQQALLFKVSRTIAADFFHGLYNEEMSTFLNHFSNLCQGKVIPDELYKICNYWNNNYARGKTLAKFVRGDKEKQAKMFSQLGYFLYKAREFFSRGKSCFEETRMALLGACGCARFINLSGISRGIIFRVTPHVLAIREALAHTPQSRHLEAEIYATITATIGDTEARIAECIDDARRLGFNVDIAEYNAREKPTEESESPRIFKKQ